MHWSIENTSIRLREFFTFTEYYFPRLNCLCGSVDLQRDLTGSDTFLNSYGSGKMDRKLRQLCDFSSDSAGN